MAAALVLPADQGLTEAFARLGMVTADLIGPASVREALGRPLAAEETRALKADVDALTGLLGR